MKNAKTLARIALSALIRVLLLPLCLLPIRKNRVLFVSYRGKQYSCSPRAISEALEKMSGGEIEIGWAFHRPQDFETLTARGIRVLDDRSFAFVVYALTARVICTNAYYKPFLPRRRGQFFLRTWHGGGAYKRVGRAEKLPAPHRFYIRMQQQGASLYTSSSEAFTRMTLREAFDYRGEVLETGLPRNDALLDEAARNEAARRARAALGLSENVRLALYAPTWRDDRIRAHQIDFARLKAALSARFGGEFRVLFRGHYITDGNGSASFGDVDATQYPDMQDLLAASDVLVTDYSSCMWDMSLIFRPVFLYCTDLNTYRADRDFFTDIRTWPFPVSETNDELEQTILRFDEDAYREAVCRHHRELGSCETGHAARDAAARIYFECTGKEPKPC